MKKFQDLTGRTFGRLTVTGEWERRKGSTYWKARCSCEAKTEKWVRAATLVNGATRSCGCLRVEKLLKRIVTHGQSRGGHRTGEHCSWHSMKSRCYNPDNKDYHNYGARGVLVCDRWLHSFENFFADMGRKPSPEHSLDRYPDKNGNYEPTNCRWATDIEQARNRRNTVLVQYLGSVISLAEACGITGIAYQTALLRLQRGEPFNVGPGTGNYKRPKAF
jgi:hypothetical protein